MAPAVDFIEWNSSDLPEQIVIDCYLPTAVLVPLLSTVNTSLAKIKEDLFSEAKTYPLFRRLQSSANYCFVCVNQKGKREELVDERLCLRDVRPFRPVLKLVERQGAREKELVDWKIKFLMGKTPKEFEDTRDVQIASFRSKYQSIASKVCSERRGKNWDFRSMYSFPPELHDSAEAPRHVLDKLIDGHFLVLVGFKRNVADQPFHVAAESTPLDVLDKAIQKLPSVLKRDVEEIRNYTLKIKGREAYLFGNYPLLQYQYVRDCIAKDTRPKLTIVEKSSLQVEEYAPMAIKPASPPPIPPKTCLTLWNIDSRFKFKLISATNLFVAPGTEIGVRAGLFHGSESLCTVKCSHEKHGPAPVWLEYLEFDIAMCDIPHMARLCLMIYAKRKNKESTVPLAWVNTMLFDFRNYLRQGELKLHAWPVKDKLQDLNPIGTVVSNINTSTSPCLTILFTQYAQAGASVIYPPFDKVLEKASTLAGNEPNSIFMDGEKMNIDLQLLTQREPLAEYTEKEKENIWFLRFECRDNFPNSLAKVLCSIKWNNHEDVARMQALLQSWRLIAPEQALELLDYKYPEKEVRAYAVRCIENFSDAQVHLFLLQLVQVLKYEAYLDCPLAKFLLRRALWNQKIGHSLFWLLRAEMHLPEVSVRFGLLLEAYCRGSISHMAALSKQVEAMNKLKAITELLQCQALKEARREKCLETMMECLQQVTFREAFSNFNSVVDPSCKLKKLRVEKCKMMDSKMRPLWMVFENDDEMGDDMHIIFKNGDDLRQDMLTVQVFRIMDSLWQREGLNLEITPYSVLPTGDKIGVIEVVTNAITLANIQKSKGGVVSGAFKKEVLLDWLKEQNPTPEALARAVEAFTLSCAGYCVATYVLGVGDRHSDNIMVKRTGQLVHIDFGHFLGNFKVKFGVNRERVPFVLSRDFVYVITNGKKSDKCPEFKRFKEICENAYLILRRHNNLFINLFTMMLSTGLPELREVKDISYLKKTLGLTSSSKFLDTDEAAALNQFSKNFEKAYKNSTSTSLNWAVHNWARDNN